jgi:hypothetical protein
MYCNINFILKFLMNYVYFILIFRLKFDNLNIIEYNYTLLSTFQNEYRKQQRGVEIQAVL